MRFLTLIILLFPIYLFSQNVSIGDNPPNTNAKLDIQSTTGGVLIPRLTSMERDAIPNPIANGLLIFNATNNRFEFWNGSAWGPIASASGGSEISDQDGDTKVSTEVSNDEDKIRLAVAGNEIVEVDVKTINVKTPQKSTYIGEDAGSANITTLDNWNTHLGYKSGEKGTNGARNTLLGAYAGGNKSSLGEENVMVGLSAGYDNEGDNNTFVGRDAGRASGAGNDNTFLGHDAGRSAFGSSNVFLGKGAGENSAGNFNVAIGIGSLASQLSGGQNIAIGSVAGANIQLGSNNILIGNESGSEEDGSNNTFIGIQSGFSNGGIGSAFLGYQSGEFSTGSGNVFIGKQAGRNENGSDKLHISTNASNPLIYGEFDEEKVFINRTTGISAAESFGVRSKINSAAYGGMYMETFGNSGGRPFYGFAIDGAAQSWLYHDGVTDELRINNNGDRLSISNAGVLKINNTYTLPINGGSANQVLTSDGSGGTSWTSVQSGGGHFEDNSGTIRQVSGYNQNFLFGSPTIPVNGTPIGGNFFFYDKAKGAFRGGSLLGSEAWSPSNIGEASYAYGTEAVAKGNYSQARGLFTNAGSYGETAIGISNIIQSSPSLTQWQANDFLFGIGNASTFGQRSNAFTVYKDGDIIVGNITGATIPSYKFQINSETGELSPFGIRFNNSEIAKISTGGVFSIGSVQSDGTIATDSNILAKTSISLVNNTSGSIPQVNIENANGRSFVFSNSSIDNDARIQYSDLLKIGDYVSLDKDTLDLIGAIHIVQNNPSTVNTSNVYREGLLSITDKGGRRTNVIESDVTVVPGGTNQDLILGDISDNFDGAQLVGGDTKISLRDFNVGIGLDNPQFKLHVSGDAAKPGGGLWSASSDRRLKKDIKPFQAGLLEVLRIEPVFFKYNELSDYDTEQEHIGVIAQELNEVAPYMVTKQSDGYLNVDASPMIYLLTNAIKELNKLVEDEKSENQKLKTELEKLKEHSRLQEASIEKILKSINLTDNDLEE